MSDALKELENEYEAEYAFAGNGPKPGLCLWALAHVIEGRKEKAEYQKLLAAEREKVARLTAKNERMRKLLVSLSRYPRFVDEATVPLSRNYDDGLDQIVWNYGMTERNRRELELCANLSPAPTVKPSVCRWKCTGKIIGADSMAWQIGCTGKDVTIGGDSGPKQAGCYYCSNCGLPIEEVKDGEG